MNTEHPDPDAGLRQFCTEQLSRPEIKGVLTRSAESIAWAALLTAGELCNDNEAEALAERIQAFQARDADDPLPPWAEHLLGRCLERVTDAWLRTVLDHGPLIESLAPPRG